MRPLLLDKSTTTRCAAVLTRLLTFSNVGSKSSHHQVRGVTRTIRQSPDTNGGAHNNNEELDVCAEALGSHFSQGLVFVERGQASSSLPSSLHNNASCRWLPRSPWGAARCGIQSSQCHVGLSPPRSQRQLGRRPHRTHGHAAVALPWVVLRGALLHGQAQAR